MLTAAHFANAFLMMALPAAAWLWLARRWRLGWRLVGAGALMFAASQAARLPLLFGLTALFQFGLLPAPPPAWAAAFNLVVLSGTAGLFEESARWLGYRWLAPQARTWRQAVVYGAGHGGMEALLVGAAAAVVFFQMVSLQGVDTSTLEMAPARQAALAAQVQAYWGMAWPVSLLGAAERALVMTLHISLSAVVLQAVIRRDWRWWLAAVLGHALANVAGAGTLQALGPEAPGSMLAAEAVVAACAALGLLVAWRLRGPELAPDGPPPVAAATAQSPAMARPPSADQAERLDDTRFTR